MRKKSVFIALVASSLAVFSGVTGRAGTLWDIDLFFNYLSVQTPSYTGSFDLTGKYDPALETVKDAQAWFFVTDDPWDLRNENEKVAVDVGPTKGKFSGQAFDYLGGDLSGEALAWLDATGTLQYTIQRTEGDFYALAAKLYVETCPKAVPDGGATLMLLGVALAGIEPLRRMIARRNAPKTA